MANAVTISGERPAGRMRRLGSLWLYRGAYSSLEDELAQIESLAVSDLRAVMRDYPLRPTLRALVSPGATAAG